MDMSKIFQRQYYSCTIATLILTLKRSLKNKIGGEHAYLHLCFVLMFNIQFIANFTIKTLFSVAEFQ
jgi:hypothetical protein